VDRSTTDGAVDPRGSADLAVADLPSASGAHWANRDEDILFRRSGRPAPFRRPPAVNSFPDGDSDASLSPSAYLPPETDEAPEATEMAHAPDPADGNWFGGDRGDGYAAAETGDWTAGQRPEPAYGPAPPATPGRASFGVTAGPISPSGRLAVAPMSPARSRTEPLAQKPPGRQSRGRKSPAQQSPSQQSPVQQSPAQQSPAGPVVRSGDWTTGDHRGGDHRTGEFGTVDHRSGDFGTGEFESGDHRAGEFGTGGFGTGEFGTGDYGTGDYGTGDYGTGDIGTGDYGIGDFGTGGHEIRPHRASRHDAATHEQGAHHNAAHGNPGQNHGQPRTSPPPGAPRRSRTVMVAALGLAVLVLLGGAAAGMMFYSGSDGDKARDKTITAPLDGRTAVSFELVAATTKVNVATRDLGDELYKITSADDTRPTAVVSDDRVQLHLTADGVNADGQVEVLLSSKVRWALRFIGGADQQTVDLTKGKVTGLQVLGASRRLQLALPKPSGTVAISVTGSIEDFSITSPKDSPVRVKVDSGAKTVAAGERTLRDVAPGSTITPKGWNVPNRYDVDAAARVTLLSVDAR
jgi:hypothetical protein